MGARGYTVARFKRLNHFYAQPLVTCAICPRARRLGAGGTLTVLRFAPLARLRPVPGFNAHWELVLGSCTQVCVLANQFQQSLKEENGGGLTSSLFGRLRCRKIPTRGFWMCWIHWCYFHSHLKTSSTSFSPLKFQEVPGSSKPSLMEDMVW